jgi:hypothetical protein
MATRYNGQLLKLDELRRYLHSEIKCEIIGSLSCETKNGIPVKMVFIHNRNKKSDWLAIVSTDLSLDDKEIVRIYGMRSEIEVFFQGFKKSSKTWDEYQGRSYDMLIAHTTVFSVDTFYWNGNAVTTRIYALLDVCFSSSAKS